jgi:hypothetical protein
VKAVRATCVIRFVERRKFSVRSAWANETCRSLDRVMQDRIIGGDIVGDAKPDAGWYDDPKQEGSRRYWDGNSWTNEILGDSSQLDVLPPPPQKPASYSSQLPEGKSTESLGEHVLDEADTVRELHVESRATNSWQRLRVPIVAGLIVLVIGGGLLFSTISQTYTIRGTFTLREGSTTDSFACSGTGGYSDIRPGTEVTVRDGSGSLIASNQLGVSSYNSDSRSCVFAFIVSDVPRADFYEIAVGRRGSLSYSRSQLERADWSVAFELGG